MKIENLVEEEKQLLVSIINYKSKESHPMATMDNLKYFVKDYVKHLVKVAMKDLTSEGQALAYSIIEKI